ncbi:MAG: M1 family metallopeptidase [Anaerolineae bacterium]|nr:M1 family metallopeptidase [Anaerolineae bacterium]
MTRASRLLHLFLLAALLCGLGPISSVSRAVSRPLSRPRAPLSGPAAGSAFQFPDAPDVASYTIDVTLDPEAKTLTGSEVITYANTSDQPIPDLVFHLYLNAFSSLDTLFMQEGGPMHRGYSWDPEHAGWIEVTALRLADGTPLHLVEIEDGTLARADLPAPIPPGESAHIEVDFCAQLPFVFARTGYAGDFFMIGQWFPKLGVWEGHGWNAHPFHANAEFYADLGTYDVTITLPDPFVTGATGLPISSVNQGDGTQTVRYLAEGVIDFAWTASPDFEAATRTVHGVDLIYLYLPEHAWSVDRALDAAEAALVHFGEWYAPYPYPRFTVVDVPDEGQGAGGMEYPMLVTAGTMSFTGLPAGESQADRSLEIVIVHETGHQWWQSTVAFNEAEEPWLDEGFTEYSTVRLVSQLLGEGTSALDSPFLDLGLLEMRRMEYLLNPGVPMYGPAWEFAGLEYVTAAYSKPTLALLTLEGVLGSDVMLDVMSTFYRRYQFAHPTTKDFHAIAEEVSGRDLSWFFDGLVYGDATVNYTVGSLDEHAVTAVRQGDLRVPTEVLVTFTDGTSVIEPWDALRSEITFSYPDHAPIVSAEVDPERKVVVDLHWSDNGLSRELYVSPWLALVTRLVYYLQEALLILGGL